MGRGTEKSGHIHRTKNERNEDPGSCCSPPSPPPPPLQRQRRKRAAERKRLCKMGKKKEVGKEGETERERESNESGSEEEGRQPRTHALTHAPRSPSRQSNPAARRQKGETERGREEGGKKLLHCDGRGRPFLRRLRLPLLSALLPTPSLSTLPTEIGPDVVGRSAERKRGREAEDVGCSFGRRVYRRPLKSSKGVAWFASCNGKDRE